MIGVVEWVIEVDENDRRGDGGIGSRLMVVQIDGGFSSGGWWI